jgi:oligopeptide/dipeptide ABC transporter ATP-binding protein
VPPDAIVDGAIIDGSAVADAIKRLFENKAFKSKEVAASLSGNAVIVKKISLPVMTEGELSESIYWEAEQYIPFDIQDVNLDYQVLATNGRPDSKGTMEVLLVAAKKERISDYTDVIMQAGRVPMASYFALLAAIPNPEPKESQGVLKMERPAVRGDAQPSGSILQGCRFQPRCPAAMEECKHVEPDLAEVQPGHWVACLLYRDGANDVESRARHGRS